MSPRLRADQIPVMAVPHARAETLHDGEAVVECDRDDCDWRTIRPERYADSAREAHRVAHARGML